MIMNESRIFEKQNLSGIFQHNLMKRLDYEKHKRKSSEGGGILSGGIFRTVILAVIIVVNLTNIVLYYKANKNDKKVRAEMIMTLAEVYAIDQSNYLLILNRE